jgi:hypothetical protein
VTRARQAAIAAAVGLAACGGSGEGPARPVAELQDPQTCNECHPRHFAQWSASMHAYASDDPVFVAMNRRGQRETSGALGAFCVKCHAPMAVELGLTTGADFDPAKLPAAARGVTCYFCHNVASVQDTHNNGLVLAHDQTMRGGLPGPVSSPAHHAAYDRLMDSTVNKSEVCGSCHDVVTPRGVKLERTYEEWQTTFFSQPDAQHHLSCGACHMPSSDGVIAEAPGLSVKSHNGGFHDHLWPAIDQALTPLPGGETLAAGIKRDLDPAVAIIGPAAFASNLQYGGICLDPLEGGILSVRMDSIGTAHAWPTGAAQDRRAWLEVVAYDASNNAVFHSGTLDDGTPLPDGMDPEDLKDPDLFGLWDRAFNDQNQLEHMFWNIVRVDSQLLQPPVTLDKNSPLFDHSSTKKFPVPGVIGRIDHITARIRIRPLSYALLGDLVGSGDLAAGAVPRLPTLDILGTQHTWTADPATHQPGTNCSLH